MTAIILLATCPAQAPTCRTASASVESVINAKARELKGTELCQFRLYDHINDLDGDKADDFLLVFSVEGVNGSANDTRQFLVAFPSGAKWRPTVVEVGRRGVRVVVDIDVRQRDVVLTTAEHTEGDALCCPSRAGKVVFGLERGILLRR